MKKLNYAVIALLFGLLFQWSCNVKKPSANETVGNDTTGNRLIVVSTADLALTSLLQKFQKDSCSKASYIAKLTSLHDATSHLSSTIYTSTTPSIHACSMGSCCPCPPSYTSCQCNDNDNRSYASEVEWNASISILGYKSGDIVLGTTTLDSSIVIHRLGQKLDSGTYTLRVTGKFFGGSPQNYDIGINVNNKGEIHRSN